MAAGGPGGPGAGGFPGAAGAGGGLPWAARAAVEAPRGGLWGPPPPKGAVAASAAEAPGAAAGGGAGLLADFAAAGIAGVAVAPVISAVDQALAENASGRAKLFPSFFGSLKSMAANPIKYLASPTFYWIWIVYGGTYLAANLTESACKARDMDSSFPKWVSTSVTNTTTCIAKDKAFAALFGTKVPQGVPMGSYAAWLGRDFISMGVIFTAPPIVGKQVAGIFGSEKAGYYAAQFGLPLVLQTITTPMHLLGYDIYNNPNNTFAQRIAFMGKDYFKNVGIRMIRMVPPWSVGTIGNREMRASFREKLGLQ